MAFPAINRCGYPSSHDLSGDLHRLVGRPLLLDGQLPRHDGFIAVGASISDDKPADVLLFTDFKDFHIADHDFGVSQITCVDSNRMMQRKDEFLSVMRKTMEERGYTLMILMLTASGRRKSK